MAESIPAPYSLSFVLFQDGEWWSAQCLEYEIAAQAKTLSELHYEIERILASHLSIAEELNQEPFAGLEPAPQRFWDMYQSARLRLEAEPSPFRLPHPTRFPPILPELRVA